jgi:hypothetical protein
MITEPSQSSARDMLKASTDLTAADFEAVLTQANTN